MPIAAWFTALFAIIRRKKKARHQAASTSRRSGLFNMGQENSTLVSEDTRPVTLSDRTIGAVADFIKSGQAKQIVIMTGAGISTAAGIPDFRSPNTGLYHNLARLNLPHPEAVFEMDFFRSNPRPFYILAKELYPGNFQPTISHTFVALLARKNLLRMLFTQNIDCLERAAGVPPELIVEAHGSFATQRCINCQRPFPDDKMRQSVESATPPICLHSSCGGLVKPDIVFFGEQLPNSFFGNATVPREADLVIVLGTSLSVRPFARLPELALEGVPRLLFNMERVGDFGTRADDVMCLGECDDGVRKLADELGWRDELEKMWEDVVGEQEAKRQRSRERQEEALNTLDALARKLEQKLKLSEDHDDLKPDAVANDRSQEKKERETSKTTPDSAPTESTAGLPVANQEKLTTTRLEGGVEENKTGSSAVTATQIESDTSLGPTKETTIGLEKVASYKPIQTENTPAAAEERNIVQTDNDNDKETSPTA